MTRGSNSTQGRHGLLFLCLFGCQGASHAADNADQPTAATSAAANGECGSRGQPDCPLQSWMKSTLQTYQREKDYERLASSLHKLAEHAPDGYAHWKETAEAGAAAAEHKDETAVSKSCKTCHNEHRARFRKERRPVALF